MFDSNFFKKQNLIISGVDNVQGRHNLDLISSAFNKFFICHIVEPNLVKTLRELAVELVQQHYE